MLLVIPGPRQLRGANRRLEVAQVFCFMATQEQLGCQAGSHILDLAILSICTLLDLRLKMRKSIAALVITGSLAYT
jgi:hypothetical protein